MRNLTEQNITQAVLAQLEGARNPRLQTVMTRLIEHLHAFLREVEPTGEEWFAATEFLTELGKKEEYILLSDVLGATILVDAMVHRKPAGTTESSVLGPFYREEARLMEAPADIAGDTPGETTFVSGHVRTQEGQPIAGALLDIWQTAPNGLYENQDPQQPDMNLRGRLLTDAEGRYSLRTVKPVSYPIPQDGPSGRMLTELGRHHFRPAHIHFKVSAEAYAPVTTQIFVEGDPYLDSDAVFGVKNSLVVEFARCDSEEEARAHGIQPPFHTVTYDFGLAPARE